MQIFENMKNSSKRTANFQLYGQNRPSSRRHSDQRLRETQLSKYATYEVDDDSEHCPLPPLNLNVEDNHSGQPMNLTLNTSASTAIGMFLWHVFIVRLNSDFGMSAISTKRLYSRMLFFSFSVTFTSLRIKMLDAALSCECYGMLRSNVK